MKEGLTMLYAAIDPGTRKVTDIMLGGDVGHMYQELIDLYNRLTGEKVERFATIEEAKAKCIAAVHKSVFGSAPTTMSPAPQPQGAVAPPWARRTEAPAPAPQAQAKAPNVIPPAPPEVKSGQGMGPVAICRRVFEELWGAPRKDIIEACARLGVKRSTAQTQFQRYKQDREQGIQPRQEPRDLDRNPSNGMPLLPPGTTVTPH